MSIPPPDRFAAAHRPACLPAQSAANSSARARRISLSLLVIAWGAQAIITQSLLLREAMVLMFGSEFAWGVVLFAWLLGVAIGAGLGGRVAESLGGARAAAGLAAVLLALGVAGLLELWIFRGARAWLGVGPGELLPLPKTALAALLLVSPASALVGMAFPLACRVAPTHQATRAAAQAAGVERGACLSFGSVYALESAGSLLAGAAFSFWAVEHLAPVQTMLICAAIAATASAGLLAASSPARTWRAAGLGVGALGAAALMLAVLAGDPLDRRLVQRRWQNLAPGYELIAEAESKYQNLAIGARSGQFSLYCDGRVAADFPDPYTFVPLAHFWLCQHPAPRRVLVLGGGAEGLLSEILRHPVEHIDYVEPDPRQIDLVRPRLSDADRRALSDARVTVHALDARHYVKMQQDRFDLVIARLPDPISALHARYYTDEFYGELRGAMTPRSVLCLTAAAAPTELSSASASYLASLRATLRPHFPHIIIGWGDPAHVLAATQPGLTSTDPAELAARYRQRGVKSDLFDPAWFAGATDWLAADKLARRAAELDRAGDVRISTDLRPTVYIQRLALWEAQSGGRNMARPAAAPGQHGWIARLRSIPLAALGGALAAAAAITLVGYRLRRGARQGWPQGAVVVSVASTGLATMALSVLWLFAFQNLYGYVYQRIGWIVALFMGGLVLGCTGAERLWGRLRPLVKERAAGQRARETAGDEPHAAAEREASPSPPPGLRRRLIWIDVLLAALASSIPFVLTALGSLPGSAGFLLVVESCISVGVLLTGLLGGAAFAVAGRLQLASLQRPGAAAANVVAADHAGACLGALLCGVLLVPVFGTAATAFLLAGIKLFSAAVLAATGRGGAVYPTVSGLPAPGPARA